MVTNQQNAYPKKYIWAHTHMHTQTSEVLRYLQNRLTAGETDPYRPMTNHCHTPGKEFTAPAAKSRGSFTSTNNHNWDTWALLLSHRLSSGYYLKLLPSPVSLSIPTAASCVVRCLPTNSSVLTDPAAPCQKLFSTSEQPVLNWGVLCPPVYLSSVSSAPLATCVVNTHRSPILVCTSTHGLSCNIWLYHWLVGSGSLAPSSTVVQPSDWIHGWQTK